MARAARGQEPPLIATLKAFLLFWYRVCIPAGDINFYDIESEDELRRWPSFWELRQLCVEEAADPAPSTQFLPILHPSTTWRLVVEHRWCFCTQLFRLGKFLLL